MADKSPGIDREILMSDTIYQFSVKTIKGEQISLQQYQQQVLLIVNTASDCGFTGQYAGLESLYQKFKTQQLVVLGFPCNHFGAQEKGSDREISEFCQTNYGVSFPLFSKIEVNGDKTEPLYEFLKQQAPGLLGSQKIKWNFTKFLVDRQGKVLKRYASATKPKAIEDDIEKFLESS